MTAYYGWGGTCNKLRNVLSIFSSQIHDSVTPVSSEPSESNSEDSLSDSDDSDNTQCHGNNSVNGQSSYTHPTIGCKRKRPAVICDPEARCTSEEKNRLQRERKAREGCLLKNLLELMQGSELLPGDDKKGIQ